jgi:hypothetical protein
VSKLKLATVKPSYPECSEPFAVSFSEGGGWYFIPTCPHPARSWRGPYASPEAMDRACIAELGANVTIIQTTVNGPNKTEETEDFAEAA